MTPEEFRATVAAYRDREEREWYRAAWMVSYLLKPHIGKEKAKTLTPEKLLGRSPRKRRMPEGDN